MKRERKREGMRRPNTTDGKHIHSFIHLFKINVCGCDALRNLTQIKHARLRTNIFVVNVVYLYSTRKHRKASGNVYETTNTSGDSSHLNTQRSHTNALDLFI